MTGFLPHRSTLRRVILGAASTLLLAAPVAGAGGMTSTASAAAAASGIDTVHLVTRLQPAGNVVGGDLAFDARGAAFVTKTVLADAENVGRVVRIAPDGTKSLFGPRIKLRYGRLHGVAVNAEGEVYVAAASYGVAPNRIIRVTAGKAVVVATTPGGATGYSAPNGLAFHQGRLYVTDPFAGAIWRFVPRDSVQRLTEPWVSGRLFRSGPPGWLGVNGIGFWNDALFVTNTAKGLVVEVPQGPLGRPGTPRVVTRRPRLVGADGLALDRHGNIWVTVTGPFYSNEVPLPLTGQRLMLLSRTGDLWHVTEDAPWMDSPNALARGRTVATRDRMFVLNGSMHTATPELVSFRLR